jgi:hypothetical protein
MPIDPTSWTLDELRKHSVDMRQFIDFRESTLPNGMRIIDCYNSSGLTFTLLPDRGLDIWTAHYKGIPLTWISQGSPHPPDYGQDWLRQFNGGLLTTCGLTHVGPPEVDDITGERRDIHGNFTRLRTEVHGLFEDPTRWYGDTDRPAWLASSLGFWAKLSESRLFGEQLSVTREYSLALDQPTIILRDTVRNVGDVPSPLMLLYHFNFGFPLVREGTQLAVAHEAVYPRDEAARNGFSTWSQYEAASPEYAEQVNFFHPRLIDGHGIAFLYNENFGIQLTWSNTLPYLTQWKNTRQGIYVCGVEPGNCIPEGRNAARRNERLQMIEPGQEIEFSCTLTVREDFDFEYAAKTLNDANTTPAEGVKLDDYAEKFRSKGNDQ